jgi:arylsulfatase A-like enzyme
MEGIGSFRSRDLGRRRFLQAMIGSAFLGTPASSRSKQRWNVLLILMDDLGWHDTGPTPYLSRLASEGVRFTNAYTACQVCSPTRASILMGKYPARLRLTDWIPGRKQWPYAKLLTPKFNQALPLEETTLAKVLRPLGYSTAAIGKWHLGGAGHSPTDQGFDLNIAGNERGSPPKYFGPLDLPGLKLEPGEFLTSRLAYEGAQFVDENPSRPFFLYEAQFTVHVPLQAPPELIEKYRQRNIGDMDPIYCAMVETADASVGRILKAFEDPKQAGNTIVIFFADNGGVRYQGTRPSPITNNTPLRAGKGHLYEGGIREPLLVRWPGVTRAGSVIHQPISSIDFFPTLCEALGVPTGVVDGLSILPLLRGNSMPERPLFWHYPHYSDQGGKPSGAVRRGDWKLMEFYEDGRLELYNLGDDAGEQRNLVRREPAGAKKLHDLLVSWRESVKAVMPLPKSRIRFRTRLPDRLRAATPPA